MRIRLTDTDLRDLAAQYRRSANDHRRRADELSQSTQMPFYIDMAKKCDARALKLETFATMAGDFILQPAAPFDGGPPSLLIVGTNANDGSAFVPKRPKRA